jgi:hypothetical protein
MSRPKTLTLLFGCFLALSLFCPQYAFTSSTSGVDRDLAATYIWIDNPTIPQAGEVISGGFVIHNYSPVALQNVEWTVFLVGHSEGDYLAAGTITEFGAGANYTLNFSSKVDLKETPVYIAAIIDPDNKIPEMDMWIDNPTPQVGEVISGNFWIYNFTRFAFKNVEWKVFSNADEVAAGTITEIRAGTNYRVNVSSQADQEGTFTIKAVIDPNNKIPETCKDNNTVTKQLTITSTSGGGQDLGATGVWIDNQTPKVGEVISGGFVIHNYSPAALQNVEWKVFSNADEVAAGTITEIGAGANYTVNASSQADQEGTFTIKAIVDPNNKIPETNENNNTVTKQLTITSTSESQPISLPKVDVAVVSVSLSNAHIKVGEDTEVKAIVKNLGNDTVNTIPVAFLVGDLNFSVQVIDSLAPGESKAVTAPLIGLMGGTYTITVIADRRQFIKETNEGNNQRDTTLVVERLIQLPLLNN